MKRQCILNLALMYFLANPHVCVLQYEEEGEEADDEVRLFMATAGV